MNGLWMLIIVPVLRDTVLGFALREVESRGQRRDRPGSSPPFEFEISRKTPFACLGVSSQQRCGAKYPQVGQSFREISILKGLSWTKPKLDGPNITGSSDRGLGLRARKKSAFSYLRL